MADAGMIISMENITKVFYTDEVETHALSGIHMEIRKGEYVAIAGPSGSGKSTLLALIGLLDSPSEGNYTLNGHAAANLDISERSRIRNREIGFIFQSFNLIGDLSVYENVELPLTYRGMPATERKERVHTALERVGMNHRTKHYPSQLSGGQQQRVAVARALAGSPAILLADEPTGNLDSRNFQILVIRLGRFQLPLRIQRLLRQLRIAHFQQDGIGLYLRSRQLQNLVDSALGYRRQELD